MALREFTYTLKETYSLLLCIMQLNTTILSPPLTQHCVF